MTEQLPLYPKYDISTSELEPEAASIINNRVKQIQNKIDELNNLIVAHNTIAGEIDRLISVKEGRQPAVPLQVPPEIASEIGSEELQTLNKTLTSI